MKLWSPILTNEVQSNSSGANLSGLVTKCGYWQLLWVMAFSLRQTEYPGTGRGGGESVVIDLISEFQGEIGSSYHLTFDNLFTSYNLVDCLTSKGMARTGTLRSSRLGDAPLKSVKELETLKRGYVWLFDRYLERNGGCAMKRQQCRQYSFKQGRSAPTAISKKMVKIRRKENWHWSAFPYQTL